MRRRAVGAGAAEAGAVRRARAGASAGRVALAVAALLAAVVAGPAGWLVSDRLERDNDFCVACHLPDGSRLHAAKRKDLGHWPPATLAAAHGMAGVREGGALRGFRCIDCHGGTGALGRARVKLLSARDALLYASGRFGEPEVMGWPLRDDDCRRCHEGFEERAPAPGADPAFHELAVHNAALGVACVDCHLVHDAGALPEHDFLHPEHVRARCAACHPQLAP
jgi:formate-dependent nitrite reductase cytochrome c552 subunit